MAAKLLPRYFSIGNLNFVPYGLETVTFIFKSPLNVYLLIRFSQRTSWLFGHFKEALHAQIVHQDDAEIACEVDFPVLDVPVGLPVVVNTLGVGGQTDQRVLVAPFVLCQVVARVLRAN